MPLCVRGRVGVMCALLFCGSVSCVGVRLGSACRVVGCLRMYIICVVRARFVVVLDSMPLILVLLA
jgi:hypothetical protein